MISNEILNTYENIIYNFCIRTLNLLFGKENDESKTADQNNCTVL